MFKININYDNEKVAKNKTYKKLLNELQSELNDLIKDTDDDAYIMNIITDYFRVKMEDKKVATKIKDHTVEYDGSFTFSIVLITEEEDN